jgi:hypothetical protein
MSAQNEDRATRLHAALDCVLDQKCAADGTSEGVRKAWETRRRGGVAHSESAGAASRNAERENTRGAHYAASEAHKLAATSHSEAAKRGGENGPYHAGRAEYHKDYADKHRRWGSGSPVSDRLHRSLDCVLNKHLPPAA